MLLLDLIENSNILCNKIIDESNTYNNIYIKKFQDIKNQIVVSLLKEIHPTASQAMLDY